MKQHKRWLNWRPEERPGEPKPAKVPFDIIRGVRIDPHDPKSWLTYERASAIDAGHIGFVLTAADGYFCVDLDHAWNGAEWAPYVGDILARFPGAYTEVSFSQDGLHIIGRGVMPAGYGTRGHPSAPLEMYVDKRFIAITGTHAQGDPDTVHDLSAFAAQYVKLASGGDVIGEWTTTPCDGATDIATDEELIKKMLAARVSAGVAFAGKASVSDLWTNNVPALADAWPSPDPAKPYGQSEADAALAGHLAFWTGKNCERIERLMRRSKLAREKWDRRGDNYLRRTIVGAVGTVTKVYSDDPAARRAQQIAEARTIGETTDDPVLPAILTLDEMLAGVVYVGATREVVHRGSGRVRTWEAATGDYAGSRHRYSDPGGKEHNVAALTAWRAHPSRITVDVVAWCPDKPEFCAPPEALGGNTRAVNLWRGLRSQWVPPNWRDWADVFLLHVAYLIPIEAQRETFLDWLAHIFQRPGELPHTCYVMIARQTGIGRNWLGSALARTLPGHVALGVSLPDLLDGGFNGRLSQKLLATVDETREGMSVNRHARGEALKRLITEESRLINTKYGRQHVEQNCCRWLMFSNHDDAVPIDNNDRRVIVIENPTQRQTPEYYASIYANLARPEFAGSVRQYLATRQIAAFNPGAHAPMSEAKLRTIRSMESGIDQAVHAFKEAWPGAIAGRSDVRNFVIQDIGATPNETALGYAIERAGLSQSRRRIRVGMLRDRAIGIGLTAEQIDAHDPPTLARMIDAAREAFRVPPVPPVPSP